MSKSKSLRWGLLIVFLAILIIAAFFSFKTAREFGLTSPFGLATAVPDFSGTSPADGGASPDSGENEGESGSPDGETPDGEEQLALPDQQAWEGAQRINILVMGLDFRDWEASNGAPRTDTMILLTVDPLTKSAGMLSIPRDLWVPIPGFEYARINAAYRNGELYDMPGGGPALAMQTVEQLLGIPIDFYAQVDFTAFERMIDEIGGVKIDIPYPIEVDPLGPGNHKFLQPGRQTLSGSVALAYARSRKSEGGDFDRAQRQQQVILAIRRQILGRDLLPILLTKSTALYAELSSGINTNMTLEQAIQLALLVKDVPVENISRGVIGSEQVVFMMTPEGDQVLKPLPDKIRLLRDQVFATNMILSLQAQEATTEERMVAEGANVGVYNGTLTSGLAGNTAGYLLEMGVLVAEGNIADAGEVYAATTIIDYTGNPFTVQFLVEQLDIQAHKILMRYDSASEVDVAVYLGNDWAASNTLP